MKWCRRILARILRRRERERNEGRWLAIVHFNILLRQWWCVTFVYSFIHFFRLLRLLLLLFERKLGRVHLHLPLLLPLFLPHSTNRFVSMSTFLADFSIQLLSTHFGLFCQISLLPSCCLFSLSSIFLSPNSNSFLFCARVCFKSVLAPTVPSFWNELGLFQWFRTHFPFGFGFFLMLLMIQSRLDSINFRFSVFTGVFFLFPFSFLFPFLVVLLYSHLLTNLCQCQPSFFLLFFLCLHFLFFLLFVFIFCQWIFIATYSINFGAVRHFLPSVGHGFYFFIFEALNLNKFRLWLRKNQGKEKKKQERNKRTKQNWSGVEAAINGNSIWQKSVIRNWT